MKHDFIYLASQSPRRQELLRQIGVRFQLLLPGDDEDAEALEVPLKNERAADYTKRVSVTKSHAALLRWQKQRLDHPDLKWAPILCADTSVSLPGSPNTEILGKPHDASDAKRILLFLSGQTHFVFTAVTILFHPDVAPISFLQKSELEFCVLSTQQVDCYVASGEPFGKAGAYGIQGTAAAFIKRLNGSYSGIMGLPLFETAQLLQQGHVCFALNPSL
jgi:septum formation protein